MLTRNSSDSVRLDKYFYSHMDYLENLYRNIKVKYLCQNRVRSGLLNKSNLNIKGLEFLPVLYLYPPPRDFFSAITASKPNPDKWPLSTIKTALLNAINVFN